ncbi:glycosyltransferase [Pontibacter sp. MBLB2868]|uniref:glycosyltransferase n=1 Tax=Pontibacter sp. MBLB2868 TaxID=3451555 RepID=UPI003F752023
MSEKRILLASLLKPVNDTRLYEKLALSLSKLADTQLAICGFRAPIPANVPGNISFYPLFFFYRLSLDRIRAQYKFYRFLLKIKPQVIIVATHELLLPCYQYSKKHPVRLIYDVQENYALNLRAQNNYPPLLRQLLAKLVRRIETSLAPCIDHFILAETSYADELPFIGNRYTILENKYQPHASYTKPVTPVQLGKEPLRLIYSGTIAENNGIFEAIALADKLYSADRTTSLTIIGYCANTTTLRDVNQRITGKSYIRLIGGNKLVPHQQIIKEISSSNVGLLPYQPNESTFRCIPTKLNEYMAHGLPVLVQQNPLWDKLVRQNQAGFSIDFRQTDLREIQSFLRQNLFYTSGIPKDIFWVQEEDKLLSLFKNSGSCFL